MTETKIVTQKDILRILNKYKSKQIKKSNKNSIKFMEKSKFRQTQLHGLVEYNALEHVPISNSDRRCTDILCTIVGLTLTITLAVFAIVTFNKPQYLKQVFPADTEGFTCGYEYPGYNYIYFSKPTDIANRYCVRSCPVSSAKTLSCKQSSGKACQFGSVIQYYDNEPVQNEYGMFCLPKDQGNRKVLMDQMKSYRRDLYYNSLNVTSKSLMIVAVISILYMFMVQCCPRVMNRVSVVVGVLALVGLTATVILYKSNISGIFRWVVFGIALLFLLIMICTLVRYFSVWGLNGIFLDFGTKFICERLYLLVLPIVFLGLGVAFYFMEILMYRSFWSFGQLKYDPAVDLYHHLKNPTHNWILTFFQIIQIIWGTMFLKQSFNYLVSAQAVQWYYAKGSACGNGIFTLVCKHLGSVIACAFMNAFFGVADFIFDSLIPTCKNDSGIFYCINRFAGFFDLARSDSLALVYLSGNAYCNSARYSEYLSQKSQYTQRLKNSAESQSASRIYRYATHFALAGITTLAAFWLFGYISKHEVAIPGMFILLLISMGVSTFFISLHADAGQAILVLFLMDEEFSKRRGTGQPNSRSKEIEQELSKYFGDHPSSDKSRL